MTDPSGPYVQERGACAGASGRVGGSFEQVNVEPVREAYQATFGLPAAEDQAAGELRDKNLSARVVAGSVAGSGAGWRQDHVEGIQLLGFGLGAHWGARGSTGARRWRVRSEEGSSSHLGE